MNLAMLALVPAQVAGAPSKSLVASIGLLIALYVALRALEIGTSNANRYFGPRASEFTRVMAWLLFVVTGFFALGFLVAAW